MGFVYSSMFVKFLEVQRVSEAGQQNCHWGDGFSRVVCLFEAECCSVVVYLYGRPGGIHIPVLNVLFSCSPSWGSTVMSLSFPSGKETLLYHLNALFCMQPRLMLWGRFQSTSPISKQTGQAQCCFHAHIPCGFWDLSTPISKNRSVFPILLWLEVFV